MDTLKQNTKAIKPFACSTRLSMEFIFLINLKIPTHSAVLLFGSAEHTIDIAN